MISTSENTSVRFPSGHKEILSGEVMGRLSEKVENADSHDATHVSIKDHARHRNANLAKQVNKLNDMVAEYASRADSLSQGQSEEFAPCDVFRISLQPGNAALHLLYDIQEEAAKRIAHRLHDESAQILATVYLELADIARKSSGAIVGKINKVVAHLDEVSEQLRRLSHELRPLILDQLGLMPALNFLAAGVRKRAGISVVVSGSINMRLDKKIETVLYRVVQEALANVVRHAGATHVKVTLWIENGKVCCTVTDNGTGFKVPEASSGEFHGLGLVGIHERLAMLKGNCKIVSSWGKGMELQMEVPI